MAIPNVAGAAQSEFVKSQQPHLSGEGETQLSRVDAVAEANLSAYPDGNLFQWKRLSIANNGKYLWDVILIKEGNELNYILKNRQTGACTKGSIVRDSRIALDVFIKILIERCEPVLENERGVSFSQRLITYNVEKGPIKNEKSRICLLKGLQELFWQEFVPLHKTRTYLPISLTYGSQLCSPYTQTEIQRVAKWSPSTFMRSELEKYECKGLKYEDLYPIYAMTGAGEFSGFWGRTTYKGTFTVQLNGTIIIELSSNADCAKELNGEIVELNRAKGALTPYFIEHDGKMRIIFLDEKESKKNIWQASSQHYRCKIDSWYNGLTIELTPHVLKKTVAYQKTFDCKMSYKSSPQLAETLSQSRSYYTNCPKDQNTPPSGPSLMLHFPNELRFGITASTLTSLELQPLFVRSYFDSTVPITHLRWGFTLIARNGSDGNHASGVVDAINDGFFKGIEMNAHVKLLFHFTGEEIKCEFKDRIKFEQRSETKYMVSGRAKEMILTIFARMKEKNVPPYDIRGSDAIGSTGDSCMTWLRKIVMIGGIDLEASVFGFIGTRTKNWTKKKHPYQNEQL